MKAKTLHLYIHILFVLFCNYNVSAQSQSDSIVDKIENYLLRSKEFLENDLDSAMYFSEEAIKFSKIIRNDTLISKSFLYKSSVLIWQNDFDTADSLIKANLEKDLSPLLEGLMTLNLGAIAHKQQKHEKAIELYIKAVEVLEKSNSKNRVARVYTNIGSLSSKLGYYENAQKYLEKALPLVDGDEVLKLQILVNLCNVYYAQKNFDIYLKRMSEAEILAKKYRSTSTLAVIYNNLSAYYDQETSFYDKAIVYAKKSIALKKQLNVYKGRGVSYGIIGSSYKEKGEYKKAISYLDSALYTLTGYMKSEVYEYIKNSYVSLGDYKKALHYASLKEKTKDSLSKIKQEEKAKGLIEKYESEKKAEKITSLIKEKETQKQIAEQAKSLNNLYLFIAIILVLLLAGSTWAFRKLKTQQKELAVVDQFKNRLFSIIAHDLRGMIIPFQRMGKIMKHHIDKKDYDRTVELSQELEKNSERLSHTLDNLLNWSLEQMDGYQMNPEQLFLGKQLQEIVDNFEQHASYKNIQIDLKYKQDIPIQFDKGAFHVIFRNLLGNALKYTDNGNVTIEFNKEIDRLECSVTDDGVGMTEEQIEDVFTLKERQTTVGTQGENGTGLGLNLVYRFVKMHQGMIKVSSKKAEGTRFDLSFPIK